MNDALEKYDEVRDNEAVYDEQIYPLMAQIIAVCKAHGIPMLASFVYAPDMFCTTALAPGSDASSKRLHAAHDIIVHGFAAVTVRTAG